MIRTKTTLVVGAGASAELELPDGPELLNKIAQGFDFTRLGGDLQTADMEALAGHFDKLAPKLDTTRDKLFEASQTIRTAARIATSIDGVLEQHNHDPLVTAVGKFAIAYYTLQAEALSPMDAEPRDPGDLPLRGNENWLFHLGRLVVNGVPRDKVEQCFDHLSIINFNYDRSVQHFLPWVLNIAFGMSLNEARQLVGEKLRIVHPFGRAGHLPWEPGKAPAADWGAEEPGNLAQLSQEIRIGSEQQQSAQFGKRIQSEVAQGRRLLFLGYGFDPTGIAMLFDQPLGNSPDVLVSAHGLRDLERAAIRRLLKRSTGIKDETQIAIEDIHSYRLLRDNALFLES